MVEIHLVDKNTHTHTHAHRVSASSCFQLQGDWWTRICFIVSQGSGWLDSAATFSAPVLKTKRHHMGRGGDLSDDRALPFTGNSWLVWKLILERSVVTSWVVLWQWQWDLIFQRLVSQSQWKEADRLGWFVWNAIVEHIMRPRRGKIWRGGTMKWVSRFDINSIDLITSQIKF